MSLNDSATIQVMATPVAYHIMMGSIAFKSPTTRIGHELKGIADIVEYGSQCLFVLLIFQNSACLSLYLPGVIRG